MKNILLALDLEPTDKSLLKHAKKLAAKLEAKVWPVHIAAPEPDFVGYDVGPQYIRDTRADELKAEHKQLQQVMADFKKLGIESEALLIQGPTIEMLEKEVEKLQIDLLIMGAHKHGFLYEAFVGHTSVKLIKNLRIPIMTIPLDE